MSVDAFGEARGVFDLRTDDVERNRAKIVHKHDRVGVAHRNAGDDEVTVANTDRVVDYSIT